MSQRRNRAHCRLIASVGVSILMGGCAPGAAKHRATPGDACKSGETDAQQQQCSDESQGKLEPPWAVCATQTGDRGNTPVDLVWVVDDSYSMKEEMRWIQSNVNQLVGVLREVALDVRLTLIGGRKICVPKPLGGDECADSEHLKHIREPVDSNNVLSQVIDLYPQYREFLRDEGHRVLIVTTDDDSEMSARDFSRALKQLPPPGYLEYVLHSIVGFGTHPLRGCLTASAKGRVYLELSDQTNGLKLPICSPDWSEIIEALTANIRAMVDLPCTYTLPKAPDKSADDEEINPEQVQVNLLSHSEWTVLPRMANAAECSTAPGWFRDPRTNEVTLCPESCDDPEAGQVELLFGCSAVPQ